MSRVDARWFIYDRSRRRAVVRVSMLIHAQLGLQPYHPLIDMILLACGPYMQVANLLNPGRLTPSPCISLLCSALRVSVLCPGVL